MAARRHGARSGTDTARIGATVHTVAVLLIAASPAAADGLRRLDAAWLIPAAHLHTAVTGCDAPLSRGVWLRAGQSRLYGLPELPTRVVALGAAGNGGVWAAEGGWETAGNGALRDDRLVARLAFGRRLRAGMHGRWRRLQPGPGPLGQSRDLFLDVGAVGRHGAVGDWCAWLRWPVVRTADAWLATETETRLRLAVAAPGRAAALTLDVMADGRPAVGWEALCAIGAGLGLSWRTDRASGATGGGLVWLRGRLRLRTSHLAHPELGLTHRFELALGVPAASPW